MKKILKRLLVIGTVVFCGTTNYSQNKDFQLNDFEATEISAQDLLNWNFYGKGEIATWSNQVSLKELDITKGVMLVSPLSYSENVIVKYKVLALTSATVIVTMLSTSDFGDSLELKIPENYDGNVGLWANEKDNYFFAFKNAPHGVTPFVRKNPKSKIKLIKAPENLMIPGLYYDIEIGKINEKLWLSINGEKTFEVVDDIPLSGGHIVIRIRGTAGLKAACLIKDLVIYTPIN